MRTVTIFAACLVLATGASAAFTETGPARGPANATPSTGSAVSTPGTRLATGTGRDGSTPPTEQNQTAPADRADDTGGQPARDAGSSGGAGQDRRGRRAPASGDSDITGQSAPSDATANRPESPTRKPRAARGAAGGGTDPAAGERTPERSFGIEMSQRECEQLYEPETGMTRQEWSAACRRVGEQLKRQRLDSLQPKPQHR